MEKLLLESLSGLHVSWNFTLCIVNTEEANGFAAQVVVGALPAAVPFPCSLCWWTQCRQRPANTAATSPTKVSNKLAGEDAVSLPLSLSLKLAPLRSADGMSK